jgi:hypothetical protein
MLQFSMILVKYSWRLFFAGFGVYTIYVRSCILGCLARSEGDYQGLGKLSSIVGYVLLAPSPGT